MKTKATNHFFVRQFTVQTNCTDDTMYNDDLMNDNSEDLVYNSEDMVYNNSSELGSDNIKSSNKY